MSDPAKYRSFFNELKGFFGKGSTRTPGQPQSPASGQFSQQETIDAFSQLRNGTFKYNETVERLRQLGGGTIAKTSPTRKPKQRPIKQTPIIRKKSDQHPVEQNPEQESVNQAEFNAKKQWVGSCEPLTKIESDITPIFASHRTPKVALQGLHGLQHIAEGAATIVGTAATAPLYGLKRAYYKVTAEPDEYKEYVHKTNHTLGSWMLNGSAKIVRGAAQVLTAPFGIGKALATPFLPKQKASQPLIRKKKPAKRAPAKKRKTEHHAKKDLPSYS